MRDDSILLSSTLTNEGITKRCARRAGERSVTHNMEDYCQNYRKFEETLNESLRLSLDGAGIPSPTSAHYFASLLFTKLCSSSVSIKKLTPRPEEIGNESHWDFASVATLTRSLIETYLVYFYLCIEPCAPEEWDARRKLMNLHDLKSRIKLFAAAREEEPKLECESHLPLLQNELKENSFFKKLPEPQQKHYLKGNTPLFKTQDEIITAAGGDESEFRFRYRFLSNHAHSFPMGFYRMGEQNRGNGLESEVEVGYTATCLLWATECLHNANIQYDHMWKE